jgi:excisionase family DNA binding protein
MADHREREEAAAGGDPGMSRHSGWTDLSTQDSEGDGDSGLTSLSTQNRRVRSNSGGTSLPTPNADQPQFLTVEEVAALLRLKMRTIYEMVSQGRIPFRKAGRRTLFDREEIIAWTARPQNAPEPGRPDPGRGSMTAPFRRRLQFGKGK